MSDKKEELLIETLMRCERTIASIQGIVKILKEAQPENLKEAVESIDIDFENIRQNINKVVML